MLMRIIAILILLVSVYADEQLYRSMIKAKNEQFVSTHNERNDKSFTMKAH